MGDMLAAKWEKYAISIANSNDIVTCINDIVKEEKIDMLQSAKVVVARDTRPSGEALVSSLIDGVKAFQAEITDFGLMSTPQLHYVTRCLNTQGTPACYGTPSAEGYYIKLSDAYKKIVESFPRPPSIKVDCANGIGAICLQKLASYLKNELNIELANHDVMSRGKLNFECGADYVKLYQKAPLGMKLLNNERSCSLDGDADRIVFYYQNEGNCQFKLVGTFKLLDGDKIATLAAAAIMKLIKISKITMDGNKPLSIGLIQTAYANGSSTSHVKDILVFYY
jgi:phosphoacetylglucosamine mutase